jgi:hypothetical protein
VALRPPAGWVRIETRRGLRWLDGPTWDHDVGLALERSSAPSVEEALARLGAPAGGASGDRLEERQQSFAGRPARRLVRRVGDGAGVELLLATQLDRAGVLVGRAGSPASLWPDWKPWLDAVFASVRPLTAGEAASARMKAPQGSAPATP